MHSVEMAFGRIHMRDPEAPKGHEPFVELHEWLRSQSIDASLRFNARFNKPSVPQHALVFGRGWLRQAKLALDVAY